MKSIVGRAELTIAVQPHRWAAELSGLLYIVHACHTAELSGLLHNIDHACCNEEGIPSRAAMSSHGSHRIGHCILGLIDMVTSQSPTHDPI